MREHNVTFFASINHFYLVFQKKFQFIKAATGIIGSPILLPSYAMENVSKRRREPPSLRPISPLMSPFPNESVTQALWDADETAESEAQERAKLADDLNL